MALTAVTPYAPHPDDRPCDDELKLGDASALLRINLTKPSDHENEMVKVAVQHGAGAILSVLREEGPSCGAGFSWFVALCLRAVELCLGSQEIAPQLALLRQCDPVAFALEMLELEMIDEIFQLMTRHSKAKDVQQHGLAIIELLVMDDTDWRDEVTRKGGAPLLCEIAKQWKDSPNLMCQVMTCLAYLAAEDYIEIILGQHEALLYVSYVLAHYREHTELVARALLALLNLTVCEPHVEELLDKRGILPVVEILDQYESDVHVVILVMGVLANFSVKEDVRNMLVQERVPARVATAMRLDPKNAALQVACLKAMVNYSTNTEHYLFMDKLGIPSLVGQAMVDHAKDAGVQRYGNYFLGQHTTCPIL